MTIISFISVCVFLTWVITGFRKGADFFSPARIYGLIWSLAIFLVEFKFSTLQFEWSELGWLFLLLGITSFLLGNYFSYIINFNNNYLTPSSIRNIFSRFCINEKRLYKIIVIYFFMYLFCFLIEYWLEGYLPLFSDKPERARVEFGIFGIHLIVASVNLILFLVAQYLIFVKKQIKKKIILIVIFIISAGTFFTLLQRYNFFMLSMMVLCLMYYSKKKIRLRTFVVFASVVVGFITYIQSLRLAKVAEYFIYSVSRMKIPVKYAALSEPYMYLVMNLENFVYASQKIETHTYGFYTFDFVMALTGLKHWVTQYASLEKLPYYISGYNTFPFFWVYYYDFGIIGLVFFPFIMGFAISEIYYYLHRKPNLVSLSMYCIAFSVIIVAVISDPLTRLDMVFNFILIVVAQYFLGSKENTIRIVENK